MIPKRIIQIYKNNDLPMVYKISQEIIIETCRDYDYKLYTNEEIMEFIINNYPQYIDLYSSLNEINGYYLFILLELYTYGGIYLSFDIILYKSFNELLNENCCIMPLSANNTIDKYCIVTNKNNKFIFYLILQISTKFNTNNTFVNNKIVYSLYSKYMCDIKLIYGEYNSCFGNFLYNIKLHPKERDIKYPSWFNNTIYDTNIKKKIKITLLEDIRWLHNIDYSFL
tara:strand:- start:4438 stop:5115 length:678 start_codon:yes stop_codon:yes gene_type:complete